MKNLLRMSNLLFVFLLGLSGYIQAQTTLIDPNAGGGFELGSTITANGWSTVNASADGWVVGAVPVSASIPAAADHTVFETALVARAGGGARRARNGVRVRSTRSRRSRLRGPRMCRSAEKNKSTNIVV